MPAHMWKLKCRAQKGMFDDEYLIIIGVLDDDGKEAEAVAFIDGDEVELNSPLPDGGVVEGFVTVSPIGFESGNARVVLPQATMANGTVVSVPTASLSPVGA